LKGTRQIFLGDKLKGGTIFPELANRVPWKDRGKYWACGLVSVIHSS